jgi:hypothetical protein
MKAFRDLIRESADGLSRLMFDRALPPPSPAEQREIDELRAAARKLPPLPESAPGAVEDQWIAFLRQVRDMLANGDPRSFARWHVIGRTMGMTNQTGTFVTWDELKRAPDFHSRWEPILPESGSGRPIRFLLNPQTSGMVIWQASHLLTFERVTGLRVEDMDLIVEFGGGYGNLCRLIHRLGFKGRYLIFDLPELLLLQGYFLRSENLPITTPEGFAAGQNGVCLVPDVAQLALALPSSDVARSLFIAVWSLSESPPELRRRVLERLRGIGAYLIAYQQSFGTTNNKEFFDELVRQRPDIDWREMPTPPYPHPGSRYLFGTRAATAGSTVGENGERGSQSR